MRITNVHHFKFGFRHSPLLNRFKYQIEFVQPLWWFYKTFFGFPLRLTNNVTDFFPDSRLNNEVGISVRVLLPAFAFKNTSWLPTTRVITSTRYSFTKRYALAKLRVFIERSSGLTLLISELYPSQVQYAVLHRTRHFLSTA
ncbi:MAG: hypothetical protein ACI8VW_004198 [bacterium]|jgi:hypothetical protein